MEALKIRENAEKCVASYEDICPFPVKMLEIEHKAINIVARLFFVPGGKILAEENYQKSSAGNAHKRIRLQASTREFE